MSFVYFIGCENSGGELRVKIGFTRRDPTQRLMDFQPGSPEELDVLCFVEGDMSLERKLHETFAGVRLHNEWFLAFGAFEYFIRTLMCLGNGAKAPTSYDAFTDALFDACSSEPASDDDNTINRALWATETA